MTTRTSAGSSPISSAASVSSKGLVGGEIPHQIRHEERAAFGLGVNQIRQFSGKRVAGKLEREISSDEE